MRRQLVFMPEYMSVLKTIVNGGASRLFKWTPVNGAHASADVFTTILNKAPCSEWFASPSSMISGQFYNPSALEALLAQARAGSCRYGATVGRIIGQELALRWVYGQGRS